MPVATILVGDVRERLAELPDGSVQACITSPPYWGLRDYGTASWDGGDETCDHKPEVKPRTERPRQGLTGGMEYLSSQEPSYKDTCGKCGATRVDSQIGLEQTPDAYVAEMVAVFREVRRVLADDGTLWLNLGDSYASSTKSDNRTSDQRASSSTLGPKRDGLGGHNAGHRAVSFGSHSVTPGLATKQLVGIPWRVAFALQADGWWLRQDIIWAKPNPMPESVTDRCTKAHEYLFLLTKSARYYYDAAAVAEAVAREFWNETVGQPYMTAQQGRIDGGKRQGSGPMDGTRNRRSVWTIATKPYAGAHFAVMPEALVEPCVLAGSREGDTVLDPFTGSGTVGVVALKHGRNFVGVELNHEYAALAEARIRDDGPLFNDVEVA